MPPCRFNYVHDVRSQCEDRNIFFVSGMANVNRCHAIACRHHVCNAFVQLLNTYRHCRCGLGVRTCGEQHGGNDDGQTFIHGALHTLCYLAYHATWRGVAQTDLRPPKPVTVRNAQL